MAKAGRRTRITLFLAMAAVAVILDQIVKAWVRSALPKTGDTAPFIPGVLRLLHVENTGAAFSMGEGKGFFFVAIAVAIFILALLAVWKEELSVPFALALGAVAGGGIGNMIDRLIDEGGVSTDLFTEALGAENTRRFFYEKNTFSERGVKRFDAGLRAAVAYEFNRQFAVGIEADFGMLRFSDSGGHNVSGLLTLSYRLPIDL